MGALFALLLAAGAQAQEQEQGQGVPVAVLQQSIARGERIEAGDVAIEYRRASEANGALRKDEVAGMEASRNLNAGALLRRGDVMRPQLVRRGAPVTIRIVTGVLVITAAGRALGGGAQGDPVRVVVNTSNRTLDGIIEGSAAVRISAP